MSTENAPSYRMMIGCAVAGAALMVGAGLWAARHRPAAPYGEGAAVAAELSTHANVDVVATCMGGGTVDRLPLVPAQSPMQVPVWPQPHWGDHYAYRVNTALRVALSIVPATGPTGDYGQLRLWTWHGRLAPGLRAKLAACAR